MPNLQETRLTLDITFDNEVTEHPVNWNWHDLLDLTGDEDVKLLHADDERRKIGTTGMSTVWSVTVDSGDVPYVNTNLFSSEAKALAFLRDEFDVDPEVADADVVSTVAETVTYVEVQPHTVDVELS